MKKTCYYLCAQIFEVYSMALAIFLLLELIKPRLVLAYLNLTWCFVIWLIIAIITLLLNNSLGANHANK